MEVRVRGITLALVLKLLAFLAFLAVTSAAPLQQHLDSSLSPLSSHQLAAPSPAPSSPPPSADPPAPLPKSPLSPPAALSLIAAAAPIHTTLWLRLAHLRPSIRPLNHARHLLTALRRERAHLDRFGGGGSGALRLHELNEDEVVWRARATGEAEALREAASVLGQIDRIYGGMFAGGGGDERRVWLEKAEDVREREAVRRVKEAYMRYAGVKRRFAGLRERKGALRDGEGLVEGEEAVEEKRAAQKEVEIASAQLSAARWELRSLRRKIFERLAKDQEAVRREQREDRVAVDEDGLEL